MNSKKIAAAVSIAATLLLTGCAGAATAAPDWSSTYLRLVTERWVGEAPSSAELIAYGEAACVAIDAGLRPQEVFILEDSDQIDDPASKAAVTNNYLVVRASSLVC